MSTINTSYAAMQYGMNTAQKIRQQDSRKADTGEKVKETEETQSTETKKLSKKAQDILKKLKDKYGNMDFFVSDTTDDTEARQIMSRGTKEYSVLLSSDELEKMAEDGTFEVLPKKEVTLLKHEMDKLQKYLGGIKDMKKLPDALFIIDPK